MGARGPVPKRSQERRRRNSDSQANTVKVSGAVAAPACPKDAHPIARRWYRSLRLSGQAQYYEPSDWVAALLLVEQMSRLLNPQTIITKAGDALVIESPLGGKEFTAIWSAMNDLFTTEAARRRARIEVEREGDAQVEAAPPGVAALTEYRKRMHAQ